MTESKSEKIVAELTALKSQGIYEAEQNVLWARDHPESELHRQLEWDNEKAGHQYRIYQMRRLIAIHLIAEDGHRKVVSLSIDRSKGGGYRDVESVMKDEDLRKVLLLDALSEFKRTKAKYQHLRELAEIYEAIDETERRISKQAGDRPAVAA